MRPSSSATKIFPAPGASAKMVGKLKTSSGKASTATQPGAAISSVSGRLMAAAGGRASRPETHGVSVSSPGSGSGGGSSSSGPSYPHWLPSEPASGGLVTSPGSTGSVESGGSIAPASASD